MDTDANLIPVKQRSEKFHELRNKTFLPGSTLFQASGLDSCKSRAALFDKVHLSVQEKEPSSEVKRAMHHGTINEINTVATICTKILPVYFQNLNFVQVGVFQYPQLTSKHSHKNGKCVLSDEESEMSLFSLDGFFVPRISKDMHHLSNKRQLKAV